MNQSRFDIGLERLNHIDGEAGQQLSTASKTFALILPSILSSIPSETSIHAQVWI